MISVPENLSGAASRLSQCVRDLGYSGCPITLDEWSTLQETIASTPTLAGKKRLNLPPVIVSCAQCGTTTARQAAEIRKHFARGLTEFYCSNECWGRGENEKRHGRRECYRCGAPAPRRASFGSAAIGRVFCSAECLEAERQEELEQRMLERMKPCARCNAMFVPANRNQRFCSRECAAREHSGAMLGESNPRWKDGVSAQRSAPHVARRYRELRPLVMRRDGEKCVVCDATKGLEVHHIDENPLNNRASNLVTLCRPCHEKAHFSPLSTVMSELLSIYAETPLSMTSRWRKPETSSRKKS